MRRSALLAFAVLTLPALLPAQRLEPTLLSRPAAAGVARLAERPLAPIAATRPVKAGRRRRAAQFLVATAGAIAGGTIGYHALRDPAKDRVKGDDGYNQQGNMGFAIGYAAGAAVAGYAFGRLDGSHGSLARTTLGATLPALPIAASTTDPFFFALAVLVMVPFEGYGATLGYQSTRTP